MSLGVAVRAVVSLCVLAPLTACVPPSTQPLALSSASMAPASTALASTALPLPADFPGLPDGAALTFTKQDGKYLLVGRTLTRIDPDTSWPTAPDFTTDGRFVYTGRAAGAGLDVTEVRTGKQRLLPYAVAGTVNSAGSTLAWWEAPNRIMSLDLAEENPQPKLARTVALPPPAGPQGGFSTGGTYLFGFARGMAVLRRQEDFGYPSGGPFYLYAAPANGPVRPLGYQNSNGLTNHGLFSPDGKRFAYDWAQHVNAAFRTSFVVVLDTATWQPIHMTGAHQDRDPHEVAYIDDLWWDRDGSLNMVYKSLDDHTTKDKAIVLVPEEVDRLVGNRWERVGPHPELHRHHLAPGIDAVLASSEDQHSLTLSLETPKGRWTIANDVKDSAAFAP